MWNQSARRALLNSYIATHQPLTEPEHEAVYQMAIATWRHRRVLAFQTMDFDRQIVLQEVANTSTNTKQKVPPPFLATLAACNEETDSQAATHRYETTYVRHYNRALRNLIELKALRKTINAVDPQAVASITGANWEEEDDDNESIAA